MRDLLTTLFFLLPSSRLKIRLLNLLGHRIDPAALFVGINLVRHVGRVEMAEGAGIGNFNYIRDLDLLRLERGARIAYLNMVMVGLTLPPEERGPGHRTLRMGPNSHVVTLHVLDCSGGIDIGEDCWVTGMRSTLLSHAFDPQGGMILDPIVMEKGSVIATSCTLLPGAVVGEGALLAAASSAWTRQKLAAGSLHGGVPARRLSPVEISQWVYDLRRYEG